MSFTAIALKKTRVIDSGIGRSNRFEQGVAFRSFLLYKISFFISTFRSR